MKVSLTREIELRCIHHLENPKLSPQENTNLYGICYGRHGHDYKVRVTVSGSINERTGMIYSHDELDQLLQKELVEPLDGRDLNQIFPNTACEALAKEIFDKLSPRLKGLVRVGVQETRKNYFEYPVS